MTAPVYTVLDLDAFREMLAGKMVELEGIQNGKPTSVHLILADIGWSAILDVITDVVRRQADKRAAIRPPEGR